MKFMSRKPVLMAALCLGVGILFVLFGNMHLAAADDQSAVNKEAAEEVDAAEVEEHSNPQGTSTIAVEGEGRIEVEPEIAYLTLGVETTDEDPQTAQEENSEVMEEVVAALVNLGIAEDDIRSGHFSIRQQRVRDEDEAPEYRVRNQLEVTVRELENVGSVLSGGVAAGVNRVPGMEFGLAPEDEEAHQMEALDKALEHTETKAQRIADFYDRELGPAKQVDEGDVSYSRVAMDMEMPEVAVEDMPREEAEALYEREAIPADPEMISFEASVDVIYLFD